MSTELKAWQAIAPEIGWDKEDPKGPAIAKKALETLTVNDFAREKFGCALDDLPSEKASRLASLLAASGYSFLVVGGKANGTHTVWVSTRGFAFVMRNWTEKDDPKSVPQTDF